MLARGTALGRFVVLGLVGRGAMGEVYGAYDPELDRKIAIKLLRPRAGGSGDGADNRTRLMREAQATAKVSHPNVVVVYDAGTFGDRVFIAMEFVEGHTLRFWLQVQERTWHEILDVFLAAGRGLAAAHERALVHRDFKPDNVMVTAPGGQVRVMDFGLARMAFEASDTEAAPPNFDATVELNTGFGLAAAPGATTSPTLIFRDKITATGAVLGTPAYMSPEQFRSQRADARSDQFSFCVALYESLYGQRPFTGRSLQELADNVVAGRVAEPPVSRGVPMWVLEVLGRGLRADPAERFSSMNDLLTELDRRAGTGRKGFATGAAAKLAGVWEAPVGGYPVPTPGKERMREAFIATGKPYAAAVFAGASTILDRFAQRWTELYVEVCEATHVRGEQSSEILDLRMACLDEGLEDLKALCRLFRAPTPEVVENAVNAANSLGTLERCQDLKLLRAVVRLPDDPALCRASVGPSTAWRRSLRSSKRHADWPTRQPWRRSSSSTESFKTSSRRPRPPRSRRRSGSRRSRATRRSPPRLPPTWSTSRDTRKGISTSARSGADTPRRFCGAWADMNCCGPFTTTVAAACASSRGGSRKRLLMRASPSPQRSGFSIPTPPRLP